jgi:hypothetical protein
MMVFGVAKAGRAVIAAGLASIVSRDFCVRGGQSSSHFLPATM